MVCVLDFKRDVGLWHGILTVSGLTTVMLCLSLRQSLRPSVLVSGKAFSRSVA